MPISVDDAIAAAVQRTLIENLKPVIERLDRVEAAVAKLGKQQRPMAPSAVDQPKGLKIARTSNRLQCGRSKVFGLIAQGKLRTFRAGSGPKAPHMVLIES